VMNFGDVINGTLKASWKEIKIHQLFFMAHYTYVHYNQMLIWKHKSLVTLMDY
jgi:hypothetical protein